MTDPHMKAHMLALASFHKMADNAERQGCCMRCFFSALLGSVFTTQVHLGEDTPRKNVELAEELATALYRDYCDRNLDQDCIVMDVNNSVH